MNKSANQSFSNRPCLGQVVCFCVALVTGPAAFATAAELSREDAIQMFDEGSKLDANQVRQLEGQLHGDPQDLRTRLRLIGYQFGKAPNEAACSAGPLAQLLVGLAKYHPASDIAYDLTRNLRPPASEEAAKHWAEAVKAKPNDPKIIGNAGAFLVGSEFDGKHADQAKELLLKARKLDPKNPRWPGALARVYYLEQMTAESAEANRVAAGKTLEFYEEAYAITAPEVRIRASDEGEYLLQLMANAAVAADDKAKAEKYSRELLKSLDAKGSNNWNYGNAIHEANLILGRLALAQGKVDEAKTFLLAAGKTPGSPQLNSFGPEMDLAEELLTKGETQAVLQYFQLCRVFWKSGTKQLDDWTKAIEEGRKPEFKARFGPVPPPAVVGQVAGKADLALQQLLQQMLQNLSVMKGKLDAQDPELLTLLDRTSLTAIAVAAQQAWFEQEQELAATCAKLLALAEGTKNVTLAERVAKICSLRPSSEKQHAAALVLARRAVELGTDHPYLAYFQMALGMAEYRSGHFAQADAALLAAQERAPGSPHIAGTSAYYRAMSLFRQGKQEEARQLAAATATKMRPLPKDAQNPLADQASADDLILWLAYREARAMIHFDTPPPQAIAPAPHGATPNRSGSTPGEPLTLRGEANELSSVAFSPDGKRIASASRNDVKLWDAQTGAETLTLRGHTGPVSSVAFSPDGKRIAAASGDGTVKVWDAQTGVESRTLHGHQSDVLGVAFSPDGLRIASASRDDTVKVWDARTGMETLTLRGHTPWAISVAFSPDGKQIASAGGDKTVKVWDAQTGAEVRTLRGHAALVFSVAFSPDGKRIASASGDGTAKVWDAQTGAETLTLRGRVASVAFSPDGKWIAAASGDRTAKVWDAQTGAEVNTLRGHTEPAFSVAFSPDGQRIASGSWGTVKVWNIETVRPALAPDSLDPNRKQPRGGRGSDAGPE